MAAEEEQAAKAGKVAVEVTAVTEYALAGSVTVRTEFVTEMVVQEAQAGQAVLEAEATDSIGMVLLGLQLTLMEKALVRMVQLEQMEIVEEVVEEAKEAKAEMVAVTKQMVLAEIQEVQVKEEQGHNMAVEGTQAAKMVKQAVVAVVMEMERLGLLLVAVEV